MLCLVHEALSVDSVMSVFRRSIVRRCSSMSVFMLGRFTFSGAVEPLHRVPPRRVLFTLTDPWYQGVILRPELSIPISP
jgi:hypothetical protein